MGEAKKEGGKKVLQKLHGYKNLLVWQKADDLAYLVYRITEKFPKSEFRLVSQIRGAAISITGNVAEGYCRCALGDYIRFLEIARGSLGELGNYIHHSHRVNLLDGSDHDRLNSLYNEEAYLLDRLIISFREKLKEGSWDRSI